MMYQIHKTYFSVRILIFFLTFLHSVLNEANTMGSIAQPQQSDWLHRPQIALQFILTHLSAHPENQFKFGIHNLNIFKRKHFSDFTLHFSYAFIPPTHIVSVRCPLMDLEGAERCFSPCEAHPQHCRCTQSLCVQSLKPIRALANTSLIFFSSPHQKPLLIINRCLLAFV